MAEGEATTKKATDFLTRKVGPLPLFVWLGAGVVIWYVIESRKSASSSSSATAAANQQTDPAGNVGTIDPATGYVYGTPEDLAALAANNSGTSSSTTGAATGATTGAQTYADNNAWGIAAVNYLVGLGIDATTANQAVQQYLASQPLTTAQQGDINLVLASPIGPPPDLPGPVATNPTSVTTPGGGLTTTPITTSNPPPTTTTTPPKTTTTPAAPAKATTAPAPTGLVVTAKHSTSASLKWNASKGATGYHVLATDMATKKVAGTQDVSSATTSATIGGLTPSHSYVFDVWAAPPTSYNGAHAEVSATLPKTG